ncbi:hypothetical protein MIND_00901800 [Mycena indigotica]|uniref:Uncharacterized protein n=1 Tax=Mycena indigotica TaxID=2126181 RepID=A0A8H6SKI9_9AGAR|nr:uncharacterized protein MIND_00901800 [Mycena indigotica]KAF7299515.1 hypothetical protein MIND_00901800 [Mycena indigotica]
MLEHLQFGPLVRSLYKTLILSLPPISLFPSSLHLRLPTSRFGRLGKVNPTLRPSSRPSSARMLSHLRLKTRFALPLVVPDIWWELSMAGHGLLLARSSIDSNLQHVDPSSAVGPPANEHEYSHCFLRLAVIKYSRALSPLGYLRKTGSSAWPEMRGRGASTAKLLTASANSTYLSSNRDLPCVRSVWSFPSYSLSALLTKACRWIAKTLSPRLPAVILLPLGVLAVHYRPERAAATTAVDTASVPALDSPG